MIPIACNLCGGRDSAFLLRARDLLHGLEGEFTYVRCTSCGMVYMNPQIAPEEMGRYYPEDYRPHRASTKTLRLSRRAMRAGLYRRPFVRGLCRRLGPGTRLLDVGCGSGAFLYQMKSTCGCEVYGVDFSQDAAGVARDTYGIEVFAGTLAEAGFPDQSFDAVTGWWVLEHVPDPSNTIAEMNRLLKEGGCCLLGIPNGASFNARVFRENWYHLDCPRHLFIYSPKTITRLLQKNGFRVDGIAFCRDVEGLISSLRYRFGDRTVALKSRRRPRGLRILRRLLEPWAWLIALAHRGDLIVVSAQKEPRAMSGPEKR